MQMTLSGQKIMAEKGLNIGIVFTEKNYRQQKPR